MVAMTTAPTLLSITLDCADAQELATFWGAALGRTVNAEPTKDYASLAGEPAWTFIAVPEGKTAKNRVHVDLGVADLTASAKRLVGLGARPLGTFDDGGYRWITLADPDGNEFVIVATDR
jgi:catechol 2,3-dioxygenase-like lactoylglutathione lyase family enzyme